MVPPTDPRQSEVPFLGVISSVRAGVGVGEGEEGRGEVWVEVRGSEARAGSHRRLRPRGWGGPSPRSLGVPRRLVRGRGRAGTRPQKPSVTESVVAERLVLPLFVYPSPAAASRTPGSVMGNTEGFWGRGLPEGEGRR